MNDQVSSDASFDELIAEAKRSFEWIDEFKVRHAAAKRQLWEQLAGSIFHELLASKESAERDLGDADPNKRLAALMVLSDHWRPTAQLAQTCEKMAFADNDAQVRGVALSGLGKCYAYTQETAAAYFACLLA